MEKGELWDDSALVKAFDRAISTYKSAHGVAGEENVDGGVIQDLDCGSRELHSQTEPQASSKLEETAASNSQARESSPLGQGSSEKVVGPLDGQIGGIPSTNNPNVTSHENEHMIGGSEGKGPDSEGYSSLLKKYYELEDQREKVFQQLNQYGKGNYYHESDYQAPVPQAYDTVDCYCYGCQNWVVPCSSSKFPCSGCAFSDKVIPKNGGDEHDFVKTATVAAERALLPVNKESSDNAGPRLTDGEGKEATKDKDPSIGSSHSATDLTVVFNAWYYAGFYTAKYISEQSAANKK